MTCMVFMEGVIFVLEKQTYRRDNMNSIFRNEQYIVCVFDGLEECLLNGNQGGKCCYEEIYELYRICMLYIVRIDEQITIFRGEIEDNGRMMSCKDQVINYSFSKRYSNRFIVINIS